MRGQHARPVRRCGPGRRTDRKRWHRAPARPYWRVLEEDGPFELLLCNARHVKHVPGRKTDVKDAQWLCQLLEAGLLTGSFVPPAPIRRLRVVTRYRKRLVQQRTSEVQRVEKVLEDAIVKIGSVASATLTKSGRAMIEALIAGERDPAALAELVVRYVSYLSVRSSG
jgi:transposase